MTDTMRLFGMEVVEVEGQPKPMLFAPCADGSAWVGIMGEEPVHIDNVRMAEIVRSAAEAVGLMRRRERDHA